MEFLINIAVRSALLAAVAGLGLWVFRVKSASVRHAIWTLVTVGMLVQAGVGPVLPVVRLRVLRAAALVGVSEAGDVAVLTESARRAGLGSAPRRLQLNEAVNWIYEIGMVWCIGQLGYAWRFTRRLLRESVAVGGNWYEARRISVPVTVGRKILLPVGWREWDAAKLRAVIAHEEAHVARWDWAVAAMARVNRCVFWFHPLVWWVERELSRLAEQVCDDAALAVVGDRTQYADVLMEMARAAGARGGRVAGAVAMAKEANVEMRIDRILDADRRLAKVMGRMGWMGLATGGAVLIYLTAAVQLAPAQSKAVESPVAMEAPPVTQTVAPGRILRHQPRLVAQAAEPMPVTDARAPVREIYNGHDKTFYFFPFQSAREAAALGTLQGIVLDPSGARVPNATVTLFGASDNLIVAAASTGTLGGWSAQVPLGLYSVEIKKPGFVTYRRSIVATMGDGGTMNTNLEVAAPVESVMVSATGTPRPPVQVDDRFPRVGGDVQMGRRVRAISPTYPASARDQGITGEVVIQALIGKSGKVLETRVTNGARAELRDAALEAVRQWEYTPALLNGEAVETLTTITISFLLTPQ